MLEFTSSSLVPGGKKQKGLGDKCFLNLELGPLEG